MPPALTPALAVDYVRELSADVRAVAVLDGEGRSVAGPPALAAPAAAFLAAGGDAVELEVVTRDGVVCAVRSASHAAVAVCGRFALPGVTRTDLRAALAALAGAPPPGPPEAGGSGEERALREAAERLISAVQRQTSA